MRKVDHKWGHEDMLVEEEEYCYEEIHMDKGWLMAYHYHPVKKETFIPISGEVIVKVDGVDIKLTEPITINPKTPHSIYAATDAVIGEVSTKHVDDDVVRIEVTSYVG